MTSDNCRKRQEAEAVVNDQGQYLLSLTTGAMDVTAKEEHTFPEETISSSYQPTIESLVRDWNIHEAARAVRRNKGAPGIDRMPVEQLEDFLSKEWPKIKRAILEGKYHPKPVQRVEIPKPDGKGIRKLGIPVVVDRMIQQAILQEISPVFEPTFSKHSYGFRPGKSAHQAVKQAQEYILEGNTWVVDIDLEKFFDSVNHDMLMARVGRKIHDKKILLLIRRYLKAGIMENRLIKPSEEGTPQGGPLSPLLSNILLDDLDRELERRGHKFCRYADDFKIYLRSEKAANRVIKSVTKYLTKKLKLNVNEDKSGVKRPWEGQFLGFTFTGKEDGCRIKPDRKRVKRFREKVKKTLKSCKAIGVQETVKKQLNRLTRGWINYFKIVEVPETISSLDGWMRRQIRYALWRQWKNTKSRKRKLRERGIRSQGQRTAYSSKGPWRIAKSKTIHMALGNEWLKKWGFCPMLEILGSTS
ncbi:MAG: Group II intron-encoded protein LtrA [Chlamydiae bacterium]|nr:Group II intron-encoded protein LtrA [Chlamydiota bacterium]